MHKRHIVRNLHVPSHTFMYAYVKRYLNVSLKFAAGETFQLIECLTLRPQYSCLFVMFEILEISNSILSNRHCSTHRVVILAKRSALVRL